MLISRFQIDFSYYQFTVYDGAIGLPGNEWTDRHFDQGFTRRDSSVSFAMLLQYGRAPVDVFLGEDYVRDSEDDRVIEVPFFSSSGKVLIEGPEENSPHEVSLRTGHYKLTAAQRLNREDETLTLRLYFCEERTPSTGSRIIVKDYQLNPRHPLLETEGLL